jgi:hypothetical protein
MAKKLTPEERRRLVAELRELQREVREVVARLQARRSAA